METKKSNSKSPVIKAVKEIKSKSDIKAATVQVGKLIRGIDNDSLAVSKLVNQINGKFGNITKSQETLKTLVAGISNAATSQPEPAKAAPVKAAKPPAVKAEKPAKPAKPAKVVKAAKAEKPAKPAKAEKPAKPAKPAKAVASSDERPPLRQLIIDTVKAKQPLKAAEIYHTAETLATTVGFKVWTRQSMYSLLDKLVSQKELTKDGDGPNATFSSGGTKIEVSDEEADKLVTKVADNSAVANVL